VAIKGARLSTHRTCKPLSIAVQMATSAALAAIGFLATGKIGAINDATVQSLFDLSHTQKLLAAVPT